MAHARRSFSVLEPAARVWSVFGDFSRWGGLIVVKDAAVKGWGDRWAPQSAPAAGTLVTLLEGARPAQEWKVEAWVPGKNVRLSSARWFGRPAFAMSSRLSVVLEPASPVETRVHAVLDSRFSSVPMSLFLNLVVPLRRELETVLARMEDGLVRHLGGG